MCVWGVGACARARVHEDLHVRARTCTCARGRARAHVAASVCVRVHVCAPEGLEGWIGGRGVSVLKVKESGAFICSPNYTSTRIFSSIQGKVVRCRRDSQVGAESWIIFYLRDLILSKPMA